MKTLATAFAIMGMMTMGAAAQMAPGSTAPSGPAGAGENLAYCLERGDGARNCGFQTMAACEAAATGQTDNCVRNPASTTGSGATGGAVSPGMPSNQLPPGSGSSPPDASPNVAPPRGSGTTPN